MEKKLVKAGVYGFVIGLFISILLYPDVKTLNEGNGMISSYQVPLRELIFDILRSSIRASIAFVISFGIFDFYRRLKREKFDVKKSFIDFLKAFIFGSIILTIVYFFLGIFKN